MKRIIISILFFISIGCYSQTNEYVKTFDWLVETFRQNDAGYQYIIDKKGEKDYSKFTEDIKSRVKDITTDEEFVELAEEWLHYFRKAHIEFGLKGKPVRNDSKSNFNDNRLHLDKLSDKTLYFRIPTFAYESKVDIDSVINANKDLIASTPNLIIDIRNGTGGSDASFQELLPFIYTSPIRNAGMLLKGSELNAQGFENYAKQTNDSYLNEIAKSLRDNKGEFVPMDSSDKTSIIKFDAVLPYPKRIAIMIDAGNVSTDEQFLIYAKQSWKVKLFGRTTKGGIDISNLNFVYSPDKKYFLVYAMSKSKRIPHFTIDDIGLQPDFFIDEEIADNDWIEYTRSIVEQ